MNDPQARIDDVVGRWSEGDLGTPGRVRTVVTAPASVLSRSGENVDPVDPVIVQLAADLVATMRVSPGASGWPPRRSGSE